MTPMNEELGRAGEGCPPGCVQVVALPEVEALLADATLLRGLSLAFRPPSPDLGKRLLALSAGLPEEAAQAFDLLASLSGEELEPLYHAILGPGGRCPTGESDYSPSAAASKGVLIGDVCGFYAAFGFDPAGELHDTQDHVAVELAFGAFLLMKTAYAVHAGRKEEAAITFQAWMAFRADHLEPWIGSFCERLETRAEWEFYEVAAKVTRTALGGA